MRERQLATERAADPVCQRPSHNPTSMHERTFLSRDDSRAHDENKAAKFGDERLDAQQSLDVHAVQVCFQLRYAAPGGEGFNVADEHRGDERQASGGG